MKVFYGENFRDRCVLCDQLGSCYFFRIDQQDSLHHAYRTLYTFKCRMCSDCRDKGEVYVKSRIHAVMREYIGG